ncbi:hypothetical protein H6G33_14685 [Calothrix sp. FACHB-1219]|uniref:hypothetical protein n=1 Tax=unclassified Calothrix TaxID=2619626 RepID=UPI0016829E73|nr:MULTISPECIES: hypothetical protein [unclassified Calothrix]MBD2203932.1 hypothetical protein [Calothrix sp. FACHB-168]MBD2218283.1 hypothetical protein [Calothrix sp. FACHB-1219]
MPHAHFQASSAFHLLSMVARRSQKALIFPLVLLRIGSTTAVITLNSLIETRNFAPRKLVYKN